MRHRRSDGFPANLLLAGLAVVWVAAIGLVAGAPSAADETPRGQSAAANGGAPSPAEAPQPDGFVGDQACATCHETEKKALDATLHGKVRNARTPAARTDRSCETCHGPGATHAESGLKEDIRRFTTMNARDVTATCLSCHNRGARAQFQGGQHDSRNISCVTCHSVHSPKSAAAQLKTTSEIGTCAACHKAQAVKITRTQHMPLVEGKMSCSSCHNPHGSTNVKQLRVGNYVNESCVSCHAEKRGPFLWEHAAGRESCITCHDPHGSSNDRMLVAKVPMLCQRCHIGTRHPSTIYDGKNVTSAATASNRIYGRGCVNCHSNIHGSNHPSGNAFLR